MGEKVNKSAHGFADVGHYEEVKLLVFRKLHIFGVPQMWDSPSEDWRKTMCGVERMKASAMLLLFLLLLLRGSGKAGVEQKV